MYRILFLTILLSTCKIYSQTSITGRVINEDNEPIPYSSIGIQDSNIGTISDENGNYKLIIPHGLNENIIFTSIGYMDGNISKNELVRNPNITLKYNPITLENIVIITKKFKEKTIGQKSKPMITFSKMFDKNVPTIEQGNIFDIYLKTKLKSYNFYIIPSSKFAEITLKVNIYSIKNATPDKILLSENILYKTNSTGWQNIDLNSYGLIFNDLNQIAITLQLVNFKLLENNDFIFGISAKKSISDDLLFRYQNQGEWEKSNGVFIANLDVSYLKGNTEKDLNVEISSLSQFDENTQMLINHYEHKEKAKKTIYGRNKNGKYVDIKDARIYYESYGKGEPLILLHGNNGSIADFYKLIPDLAKHFNVITLDTRGQGRSTDLTTSDYTYELFAADLLELIKHLGLKKINILGWSDGGNTGLIFNSKHPELVRKIITIGANLNPKGVKEDLIKVFQSQISEQKGNQRLIKLMLNHPNITPDELRRIQNPVLILAGSEDVIKEGHTEFIHKSISGSELEIISNATHYIPFEQPDKLSRIITTFLQK